MSIVEQVNRDMIAAMKQHDAPRVSTLRMIKSAFKNKEIEQRAELSDTQAIQVLTTQIKQRRDSVEQFTRGNRPELAAKETAEIALIEEYMPKAAGEAELQELIAGTLAELRAQGTAPTTKDLGLVMKAVQAKVRAGGIRADGRQLSDAVKAALAG